MSRALHEEAAQNRKAPDPVMSRDQMPSRHLVTSLLNDI